MADCSCRNIRGFISPRDLNQTVIISDRDIKAPVGGNVNYTIDINTADTVQAKVETVNGSFLFDSTGVTRTHTHTITMRFLAGVTPKNKWLSIKNEFYDMLDVQNLNEDDEWLIIRATKRGSSSFVINRQ